MKKRLLFIVMMVIVVAAAAAFAIACDDGPHGVPRPVFEVSVDYDDTHGSVVVKDKDGREAYRFLSGESATITVTPDVGYSASLFTVNGEDAELDGGTYTIEVKKNIAVVVEFALNTYTVSADYNDYRGTVDIKDEDGNAKTTFVHGDAVTVSASAKIGFELVNFTVNGEKQQLENGAYSFEITSDTTIDVAFGLEDISQDVIDASKSNLLVAGTNEYTEQGQRMTVISYKAVFGTDSAYIEETQENGEISFAEAYVDQGGILALVTHTIDNDITYTPASYYDAEAGEIKSYPFEEYYNPFALLSAEDFELTDKADVFALKDSEKRRNAARALTSWNDPIKRFEVLVEDGKITAIEIETADNLMTGGVPCHSLYRLTATEHGTAELDEDLINPFATTDEHELLRAALMEMAQAENYTVNITDSELGYEDIVYNSYVTKDIIYEDCVGYENGYVNERLVYNESGSDISDDQDEQKVYPFDYREKSEHAITLYDPLNNIKNVRMLHASFIGGYAVELFKLTENTADGKVFTLRCDEFAGDIFAEFGDGLDKMKYYAYALNGKIMLDENDKLLGASFDCYVYGSYSTVTLIYFDVNSTVAPDFSEEFAAAEKVSMYDDYVGTYVDRNGSGFTVEIDKENGIVINGEAVTVITYSRLYDVFVVDCDDTTLYITKKTEKQLVIYDEVFLNQQEDNFYIELILESDEEVIIPKAYRGEWSGVCYYEQRHEGTEIAFDEGTSTITCTFQYLGDCTIVGGNDDQIDALTVTIDGDELTFERKVDPEERFEGEIIPLKYTGGYSMTMDQDGYDINFILAITNDEIVLTIDGEGAAQAIITRSTVTIVDNGYYELEVLSYDETDGVVCYDYGYTYYFKLSSSGEKLFVTIADGAYLIYDNYVFGDKQNGDDTIDIPEEFIGAYNYFSTSSYPYVEHWLVVTADEVKFVINGGIDDIVPVKVVEVKEATGNRTGTEMTIDYNGVEYTVFLSDEYNNTTDGKRVTVTSGTSFSETFIYQEIAIGDIPQKFNGDFLSSDGEAMVCIDDGAITFLMLDGVEVDFEYVGYTIDGIEITINGEAYYITDMSYDDPITKLYIFDDDYTVNVILTRYAA